MTWLDALILFPLLVGLVRGLTRGMVREIIAIVDIIVGILVARIWGADAALWIQKAFGWTEAVSHVFGYGVLFLIAALMMTLVGRMLTQLLRAISLGGLDRLIGALIGVAKAALLVMVVVYIVSELNGRFHFMTQDLIDSCRVYDQAVTWSHQLLGAIQSSL